LGVGVLAGEREEERFVCTLVEELRPFSKMETHGACMSGILVCVGFRVRVKVRLRVRIS